MNISHHLKIHYKSGDGITTVVRELAPLQDKFFSDVSIFPYNTDDAIACGREFKYKGMVCNIWKILTSKNNQKTINIIHGVFSIPAIVILMILKAKRQIVCVVPHASLIRDSWNKNRIKKKTYYSLILGPALRFADEILFLNEEEKSKSIFPVLTKWSVHTNGVLQERIKRNPKDCLVKNIVYIGRYDVYHKGLDILIEQYRHYLDRCEERGVTPVTLELYGTGSKGKKEVGSLLKKFKLTNSVYLGDGLYDDEKESKLTESLAFLLPSRYEGVPMALLEAMAHGCIPIVSENTNLSSLITKYKCGWIFGGEKSLSEAINEYSAASLKELQMMSGRAIRAIYEQHNWNHIVSNQYDYFKKQYN